MTTDYDILDADSLTQREFDALLEYSSTIPSDVEIGKKWKRREPYRDDQGPPFFWLTGEYVPDPAGAPKMAAIKWRRAVIVNNESKGLPKGDRQ